MASRETQRDCREQDAPAERRDELGDRWRQRGSRCDGRVDHEGTIRLRGPTGPRRRGSARPDARTPESQPISSPESSLGRPRLAEIREQVGPPSTKIFCPVICPPTGIGDDRKHDASEVLSAAGVRARRARARPLERTRDSNPRPLPWLAKFEENASTTGRPLCPSAARLCGGRHVTLRP